MCNLPLEGLFIYNIKVLTCFTDLKKVVFSWSYALFWGSHSGSPQADINILHCRTTWGFHRPKWKKLRHTSVTSVCQSVLGVGISLSPLLSSQRTHKCEFSWNMTKYMYFIILKIPGLCYVDRPQRKRKRYMYVILTKL